MITNSVSFFLFFYFTFFFLNFISSLIPRVVNGRVTLLNQDWMGNGRHGDRGAGLDLRGKQVGRH